MLSQTRVTIKVLRYTFLCVKKIMNDGAPYPKLVGNWSFFFPRDDSRRVPRPWDYSSGILVSKEFIFSTNQVFGVKKDMS